MLLTAILAKLLFTEFFLHVVFTYPITFSVASAMVPVELFRAVHRSKRRAGADGGYDAPHGGGVRDNAPHSGVWDTAHAGMAHGGIWDSAHGSGGGGVGTGIAGRHVRRWTIRRLFSGDGEAWTFAHAEHAVFSQNCGAGFGPLCSAAVILMHLRQLNVGHFFNALPRQGAHGEEENLALLILLRIVVVELAPALVILLAIRGSSSAGTDG